MDNETAPNIMVKSVNIADYVDTVTVILLKSSLVTVPT